MRADLHLHTTASDGAWAPEKLIRAAAHGGLDVVAVADHDTMSAVPAARRTGEEVGVQVVPAMEVSSTHGTREIHVLGYFLDPGAEAVAAYAARAGRLRLERMAEMVKRLEDQGTVVSYESVLAEAGSRRDTVARPHLARALVAAGYATSVPDAFQRYIGDHCPAFVPTRLQSPAEAVAFIAAQGGVAVWAHPPGDLVDALLPGLVEAGLDGLEVYRPSHSPSDVARLEGICRSAGLVMGGGSDWHTPESGTRPGDFFLEGDCVAALLSRGGVEV